MKAAVNGPVVASYWYLPATTSVTLLARGMYGGSGMVR